MAANALSSMVRRSTPRISAPSAAPVGTTSRAWAKGMMDSHTLALVAITLFAATVNGALGYGFSSLTVPVALLFLTNRVLNPALVPIEVVLNAYVLWVNRGSVPVVWRRVMPIVIALAPGVIVGTTLVSLVHSDWLKFITYVTLLPLILLQAAGFRRPLQSERAA